MLCNIFGKYIEYDVVRQFPFFSLQKLSYNIYYATRIAHSYTFMNLFLWFPKIVSVVRLYWICSFYIVPCWCVCVCYPRRNSITFGTTENQHQLRLRVIATKTSFLLRLNSFIALLGSVPSAIHFTSSSTDSMDMDVIHILAEFTREVWWLKWTMVESRVRVQKPSASSTRFTAIAMQTIGFQVFHQLLQFIVWMISISSYFLNLIDSECDREWM